MLLENCWWVVARYVLIDANTSDQLQLQNKNIHNTFDKNEFSISHMSKSQITSSVYFIVVVVFVVAATVLFFSFLFFTNNNFRLEFSHRWTSHFVETQVFHILDFFFFVPLLKLNTSFGFHAFNNIGYPVDIFSHAFHKSYASIGIYTYVWLWPFVSNRKKKKKMKTFLPSTLIATKLWLCTCQLQQQNHQQQNSFHPLNTLFSLMIALFSYR